MCVDEPLAPLHVAQARTIYGPFFGLKKASPKMRYRIMNDFVDKRRLWLDRLSFGGDKAEIPLESVTFHYNCRPCGVKVQPRTRFCNQRGCPFCYGRSVGDLFMRLYDCIKLFRKSGVALWSWSKELGEHSVATVFYEELDEMSHCLFTSNVRCNIKKLRGEMFKQLKGCYGGVYSAIVTPVELDPDTHCGYKGYWHVWHRCVFLAPADWKPPKIMGRFTKSRAKWPKSMAAFVGRSLEYIPRIMVAPPVDYAIMEEWLDGDRPTFTSFGVLGKHGSKLLAAYHDAGLINLQEKDAEIENKS